MILVDVLPFKGRIRVADKSRIFRIRNTEKILNMVFLKASFRYFLWTLFMYLDQLCICKEKLL